MEKITSKLFFLFSTLFLLHANATDIHYCDRKANYDVEVKGVQITPDPIARGHPATFTISATTMVVAASAFHVEIAEVLMDNELAFFSLIQSFLDAGQALSGGKLLIDVSYFGWHVYSETHDLCGESSCPISVGDFVIAHSQVLPGFTPPGSYTLKMKLFDGNKNELTCITFGFDIGFGDSVADS
ncbi:hypothetical protein TSUD_21620 [Trifolium subterraneum]|uniref:MD-2-related lipid-recognition domain-containing protein n=1 Tax=Trifolium subterraneum TaxID=3900 RepID=A0A2Z6MYL6_TRISU|nr:hypothetical protein TSUD_21620 [Trifolium subterraneum]